MKLLLKDAEILLTERAYVGEGYQHRFRHDTGVEVFVETTKDEYERMGQHGGVAYNPCLENHTWLASYGGTIKVDSESGSLSENEYCIIGNVVFICLKKENGDKVEIDFPYDPTKDSIVWPA